MSPRRSTSRLHAAMRDTHCPVCGVVIYRTHSCHGRPAAPLTPDELAQAVDACRAALAGPSSPATTQEGLF